ncbi:hypothetical protein [Tenacibaculum sp. IB213877]|uniref:hypothetical protein n=1 Tax=Tenacibaculum sp. IB213877 TaxID=3097351 RepID=UPI002A5A524B|nr:hypothetical protein [Tenacibaculum sp. IB213877]MDY0779353.1 hypothetical protein [Tenacibaculum sp. IB213877]
MKNLRVFRYNNTILPKLQSFEEVNSSSPEGIIQSSLSASSMKWYNYNIEVKRKGSTQDFEYIRKISPKKFYDELLYKISFETNGFEYAIIKYYFHNNNKIMSYSEVMKKIGSRWFIVSEPNFFELTFFMMMVDVNYIDNIFKGVITNNKKLNNIISKNKMDVLDLNGILFDLAEGFSNGDKDLEKILDTKRIFK